ILSEACRNVASGTTKAVSLILICAVGVGLPLLADLLAIGQISRQADIFEESWANVQRVEAQRQIDGNNCDGLVDGSSLSHAGGLREGPVIEIDQAPGVAMTSYEVTPGFIEMLTENAGNAIGVWIESSLAETLVVKPGVVLSIAGQEVPVAGVFDWPADGRDARLRVAMLIPVMANGQFDECWARSWPMVSSIGQLLWSTVSMGASGIPMLPKQINASLGSTFDEQYRLQQRVTRAVYWVVPLVMAGVGCLTVWRRRLEYATHLHLGQSKPDLLSGVALETGLWALLGSALGVNLAMVLALSLEAVPAEGVKPLVVRMIAWPSTAAVLAATILASTLKARRYPLYAKTVS
ncbi:MAG: hypothetical protein LBV30_10400, partial [Propionibacteriaceae bacterium]|nr:hypothetical protein [Propionibacteriaceae bacterium]